MTYLPNDLARAVRGPRFRFKFRWPLTLRETVLLAVLVVEVMWSRGVLA